MEADASAGPTGDELAGWPRRRILLAAFRLVAAWLVAMGLVASYPRAFPSLCLKVLPGAARFLDLSWEADRIDLQGENLTVDVTSRALTGFSDASGAPLGTYSFPGSHRLDALNIYPVTVLTLLLGLPMLRRMRLYALLPAMAGLLLAGLLELVVIVSFLDARALSEIFSSVSGYLARTPEGGWTPANEEWLGYLQARAARIERSKAFLSSGGRQVLSVLVVALGVMFAVLMERPGTFRRRPRG